MTELAILLRGLLLLTITMPLAAHETFVAPVGTAAVGAPLELRLSSTGRFPRTETAILPARVVALSASIDSDAQSLRATASRTTWLTLEAQPAKA